MIASLFLIVSFALLLSGVYHAIAPGRFALQLAGYGIFNALTIQVAA